MPSPLPPPPNSDFWDSIPDDEVLDILGPPDSAPPRQIPKYPPPKPPLTEDIPNTPKELGYSQEVDAVIRVHENPSTRFRFPLASLDAVAGPIAPGELWVVGGRQGNGKSLFFQNVAAWLLEAKKKTLYMGTEQDAPTLKVKQACVMTGVSARLILKPTEEERQTDVYRTGSKLVLDALALLSAEPQVSTLMYSNNRFISRTSLSEWVEVAVGEWGVEVVIVDHLHHMQHGPGKNPVSELTETVHHAKGLAVDEHIAMLAASQITRTGGDPIKAYTPPAAEDFAGASAIERTADVMLALWRPLRLDLDVDELRALREKAKLGYTGEEAIYQPNVMGVRCVKDRLGDAPGKQTMLAVASQKIGERGRDAYATDYDSLSKFGRPKT
jgi:predicted ATP-dependent serine protease